ncbi:ATP-binding cassette domain-containing protein [Actinosynnema pretiosum subsp. pretiosum]|uniref:Fatty acid ABC transporter ATP-binding/permease protein n=1 Tax=Actinosynnema pretiosum subsp. pretiosum TaxID=103721 RepID=A0AA45R4H4_9PSEU|nr:ATP-binding cassette domain-containing protein [Actinosynnema pretiosum subsp. pretiosum]
MTSLLVAAPNTPVAAPGPRVRSAVPGRQRWDVPQVLRRPVTAHAVETALLRLPGVTTARANPTTGRVLVLHDRPLDVTEVARALRVAVTIAARVVADRIAKATAAHAGPTGGDPAGDDPTGGDLANGDLANGGPMGGARPGAGSTGRSGAGRGRAGAVRAGAAAGRAGGGRAGASGAGAGGGRASGDQAAGDQVAPVGDQPERGASAARAAGAVDSGRSTAVVVLAAVAALGRSIGRAGLGGTTGAGSGASATPGDRAALEQSTTRGGAAWLDRFAARGSGTAARGTAARRAAVSGVAVGGAARGSGGTAPDRSTGGGSLGPGSTGLGFAVGAALRRPVALVVAVTGLVTAALGRAVRAVLAPLRRTALGGRLAAHPLAKIIRSHRGALAKAATLSVLCQFAELSLGVLLGWVALILIKGEFALLTTLGVVGASTQLWVLAGAAAVACGVVAGLSYLSGLRWRALGQAVRNEWRARLHDHAQRLEMRHIQRERPTRVAGVLADDVDQLGAFFAGPAAGALQLATSVLVLVPAFLLFAPTVAWVAFLPMPLVAALSLRHRDRSTADHADSGEHRARLRSRLTTNLEAAATVKSSCAEDHEAREVQRLGRECAEAERRTNRHGIRHSEGVRALTTASMTGTLLVGGRQVLSGAVPFEVFSPLIGLPQQVILRLSGLGTTVDQYQRTLSAFDRVQHLLSLPAEPTGGRRLARDAVRGEIVLNRVCYAYPGRPRVLRELSLRAEPGQVTGIVGATGSGKTTIAKLLTRFQEADSGEVLLDGHDVRGLHLPDLRAAIGFVAQDAHLFDGTIADNIRYGAFSATDEQVRAAARTAEAHEFVEALPLGYDTLIGEHGAALSGGQRQRIVLARTVLRNPPVVVLDEATSAVDNKTEAAIQRALARFSKGRTTIVIAHRLSTIRNAHRIHVLDKGGVVAEQGTHDELLARSGLYASLWQLQAGAKP